MKKEMVENFIKANNGYITTSQFETLGISKVNIPLFVKNGIIKKSFRGVYIGSNYIEDCYYELQLRYNDIIFSHNTAFYLQNISERTPFKMELTTFSGKKVRNNYIKIYYVSKEKLNIGVIEIKSPYGNNIKVYNLERSVCDMIKYKNDFDLELYNKILDNCFNSKDFNLKLLLEYSKIFNIEEKVKMIVELMMK